jgi:hypothetical protein
MPRTLQDTSETKPLPLAAGKVLLEGCNHCRSAAVMTVGAAAARFSALEGDEDAKAAALAWLASSVSATVDAGGEHATRSALRGSSCRGIAASGCERAASGAPLGSSCSGDASDIAGERAISIALASVPAKLGSAVSSLSVCSAGAGGASAGGEPLIVGKPAGRNVGSGVAEGWLSKSVSRPPASGASLASTVELEASVPVPNATGVLTVDPVGTWRLGFVCRPLEATESRRTARFASSDVSRLPMWVIPKDEPPDQGRCATLKDSAEQGRCCDNRIDSLERFRQPATLIEPLDGCRWPTLTDSLEQCT